MTLLAISAFCLMVLLAFIPIPWARLGGTGYLGLFVASVLSGTIAFAPGPAWGLMFSAARVLSPTTVGLVGGSGIALGEIATYVYGRTVLRNTLRSNTWVAAWSDKLTRAMPRKWWWWALSLFLITLVPVPLFDFVSIGAGQLRVPFLRYFVPVFLARVTRALVIAYVAGGFPRPW